MANPLRAEPDSSRGWCSALPVFPAPQRADNVAIGLELRRNRRCSGGCLGKNAPCVNGRREMLEKVGLARVG